MDSRIFWIDSGSAAGKLAILARPRGNDWLEDDVRSWSAQNIKAVVCLLDRDETAELGLEAEADLCEADGIGFESFPIPDRGVPGSFPRTRILAEMIASSLKVGNNVRIQCRAGIGRSGLIAATVLVMLGYEPDEAFALIGQARGVAVPDTEEQRSWLTAFARALGR